MIHAGNGLFFQVGRLVKKSATGKVVLAAKSVGPFVECRVKLGLVKRPILLACPFELSDRLRQPFDYVTAEVCNIIGLVIVIRAEK